MAYISLNVGLLLIAIITFSIVKFTKTDIDMNDDRIKQKKFDLVPLHYDVKIELNLYKSVFFGECNITLFIDQTNEITINNSATFAIYAINLINNNNSQIINIVKFLFVEKEYIRINLVDAIYASGIYILNMLYVGTILDYTDFFGSLYIDEKVEFDSFNAIRAGGLFPCWDVPDDRFKSTFSISFRHHKDHTHISNVRIRDRVEDIVDDTVNDRVNDIINDTAKGMMWTHYNKSSLMSAQNLGFIITTLTHTSTSTENIKFWCKKELMSEILFAETIAQKIVHYLNERSTRKVEKMDYFVINDFQSTMTKEFANIRGVIILRDVNIIYNDALDDSNRKIEVANLITYQTLAHWFNDVALWSKEGFLTYFTAHVLNQSRTYNDIVDLFVVQIQQESLRLDTLPDMKPLPPLHTITADSFRSSIHYIKSSVMWRMFYYLINDEVFWDAINIFVDSNKTIVNDFWDIAQTTFNKAGNVRKLNIKRIFNAWITETRCSEVMVERYNDYEQVMRYVDPDFKLETCPAVVQYERKYSPRIYRFMFSRETKTELQRELEEDEWLLINTKQSGYYYVNYSMNNWQLLGDYLYYKNNTRIHVINRAQIIDDSIHFLKQKQLNFSSFWNITKFLHNETDYIAWYPMIKFVELITCIFPMTKSDYVTNKLVELFNTLLTNIGYYDQVDESGLTKTLRQEAVKWACFLRSDTCRTTAQYRLSKDLSNPVQSRFFAWKQWIYCKGLMIADDTIWMSVYDKWQETNETELLEYLICSKDPTIGIKYLMIALKNEFLFKAKGNRRAHIILYIIARHIRNNTAFNFIMQHFKDIEFTFNRYADYVVILNVIITFDHSVDHFKQISEFVKEEIKDEKIMYAVEEKIKTRKSQYNKYVLYYGQFGVFKKRRK
nr:PREDICTED: aminopeptidase N-like isoform X1 [Linepithema humile]